MKVEAENDFLCLLMYYFSWRVLSGFCFAGIVYSFGIELRDGPLLPCTLELPEDQIIPTAEENFAALRVIFERVFQAVVPAK